MTAAMILEMKRFDLDLPTLSEMDRMYILGHKVALETTLNGGDASFERDKLSRLIMQHAWSLAYQAFVRSCIASGETPMTHDEFVAKTTGEL